MLKTLEEAKTDALKNEEVKKELNKLPQVGQAVAAKEFGDYVKAEGAKTTAEEGKTKAETAHKDALAAILTNDVVTVFTTDSNFTSPAKKLSDAHADAVAIVNAIAAQKDELLAYAETITDSTAKANAKKAIAKAVELAAKPEEQLLSAAGIAAGAFGASATGATVAIKTAAEAAYGADGAGTGGTKKAHKEAALAALNAVAAAVTDTANGGTDDPLSGTDKDKAIAVLKALDTNKADFTAYIATLTTTSTPSKENAEKALKAAAAVAADESAHIAKTGKGGALAAALADESAADKPKKAAEGAYGTALDGAGGTKKGVTDAEAAVKTAEEGVAKAETALTEAVAKADATVVESAQKAAGTSKNLGTF